VCEYSWRVPDSEADTYFVSIAVNAGPFEVDPSAGTRLTLSDLAHDRP
jgi:hypothetical protein